MSTTARVITTTRGPIETAVVGSGPVVLLVHGMPGDWRQARPVADLLAADHTVVSVSRPGYGRTPLRTGRTIDDQAQAYAALLDVLAVERATVVGVSGGGPSAASFSRLLPERTAGLVLVSAVCPDLLDLPALARRVAAVPGVWEALWVPTRLNERRKLRGGFDELTNLTPAEVSAVVARPAARADLRRYVIERPSVLRGPGLRNDIVQCWSSRKLPAPTWSAPTVILHGDEDVVVPLPHAQAYASRIDGARLEVFNGWGHALPIVAADRVADAARELALA